MLNEFNRQRQLWLKSPIFFCLSLFIFSRLIIFFGFWYIGNISHPAPFPFTPPPFLLNFIHWDSNWYLNIIEQGYSTSPDYHIQQNYAFFPLYPLLSLIIQKATGLSSLLSGLIVSHVAFLFALYFFYLLLLELKLNEYQAKFGALLLAFAPENIYFISIYTESLFLALSIMNMYYAYREKWFNVGITGLLLTACRPNGIMIIIPLLWMATMAIKRDRHFKLSYLWIFLTPMGIILYMIYLHFHVGDYLAFQHVQAAWNRQGWHLDRLWLQIRNLIIPNQNNLFFLFAIISSISLYKSKYWPIFIFYIAMFAPALLSGGAASFERYTGSLFPFYIGALFLTRSNKILPGLMLSFFTLMLGLNISGWMFGLQLA